MTRYTYGELDSDAELDALAGLQAMSFGADRERVQSLLARNRDSVRVRDIGIAERSPEMRPVRDSDLRRVDKLYRDHAQYRHGWLDRGPYIWSRVRQSRGPRSMFARWPRSTPGT